MELTNYCIQQVTYFKGVRLLVCSYLTNSFSHTQAEHIYTDYTVFSMQIREKPIIIFDRVLNYGRNSKVSEKVNQRPCMCI
jgi:hypothetical protein